MPVEPSILRTTRARDLDLLVGAEAEPHGLVLRRERHLAAADEDAVAIERDPAGQQRRLLGLLEAGFQERGLGRAPAPRATTSSGAMIAVAMRKLLAPSLAATEMRPGMRKTTWKPPVSSVGFAVRSQASAARAFAAKPALASSRAEPRIETRRDAGAAPIGAAAPDSARSAAAIRARCRPSRCARSRPRARHRSSPRRSAARSRRGGSAPAPACARARRCRGAHHRAAPSARRAPCS